MMKNRKLIHPKVIVLAGYPLLGDAFRGYLKGFYSVETIAHDVWHDGLAALKKSLQTAPPTAPTQHRAGPPRTSSSSRGASQDRGRRRLDA